MRAERAAARAALAVRAIVSPPSLPPISRKTSMLKSIKTSGMRESKAKTSSQKKKEKMYTFLHHDSTMSSTENTKKTIMETE